MRLPIILNLGTLAILSVLEGYTMTLKDSCTARLQTRLLLVQRLRHSIFACDGGMMSAAQGLPEGLPVIYCCSGHC